MRSTILTFAAAIFTIASYAPVNPASLQVQDALAPDPLCPYPSEDLTFFPNPDDCSQYYECYEGNKYLINCPNDMSYDISSKTCLAYQLVNCNNRGQAAPSDTNQAPPETGPASSEDTGTGSAGGQAPEPLCPYPSEDLTFFAADDCSQYWECYEGKKYLITCPKDTYWNIPSNTCENKLFVNCGNRSPATPAPNQDASAAAAPGSSSGNDQLCPYPSEDLTFFAADDCSQYWECYEGKKYLITCPKDTYWNIPSNTCENKLFVNCGNRSPDTPAPNQDASAAATPGSSSGNVDQLCPYPSEDLTFFAADDCSQYWECYEGKKYLITCPKDTYWNIPTSTCENKLFVSCGNRSPATPAPNSEASAADTPGSSSGNDQLCPYPSEDLTFFAADDCSQYWECYEGKKYLITCPKDTYWNIPSNTCENKLFVSCGNRSPATPAPNPEASEADTPGSSSGNDQLCPYPSEDLTFFAADDCSQYWECYEGNKYLITCPKDTYWNIPSNSCENKMFVNCGNRSPAIPDPNTDDSPADIPGTSSGNDQLCPYPSEDLTFFAADDCSQYWECYEGNKYLITCPKDTYWNIPSNTCESKLSVNCGNRSPATPAPDTEASAAATPGSSDGNADGWAPDPLCPYPSEDLIFFAADDCSQYWECYEGNKYLITCPKDTYWDISSKACEDRQNVNCDNRLPAASATEAPTSTTTLATGDWAPYPLCPYPSEDLTFFPALDCAQYWECYQGNKYLLTCPRDMYWNIHSAVCEAKEFVSCDNRYTAPASTLPPATDELAEPLCPYPSEELIFLPASECSQYWECFEGNRFLLTCPKDMYWNVQSNVCEAKEFVNCGNRSPATPALSTAPSPTVGAWVPDPSCPYPSEDLTFFPADDCSQYWECYEGNKYLISCPKNMLWNHITNICETSQDVNCNRLPSDPNDPNGQGAAGSLCAPEGSLHPDPDDCSKFYECAEGKLVLMECPLDTYWNQNILTCDYIYDVRCAN